MLQPSSTMIEQSHLYLTLTKETCKVQNWNNHTSRNWLGQALPFPIFELQSKWVAGVLSGRCSLPSEQQMIKDVEAFYLELKAAAVPKRYTHLLAENDWLAAESGCQPWEEWRKQMLKEHVSNYLARPETYRDEWKDEYLIVQAQEDFCQYSPRELCGNGKEA
ncbi:hypothetical protein C5167_038263 [Papaver somniferum]|uniref:Uncharacterized protein n=1 Tax=Papaver somniferum TaxID=3469 RepID=A0A4Y7IC31_PAPSO|nr:hypothetical protein C5167_038263 [Papaver somniferum]